MPRIASIADLRQLAQQRVPKMFFDYAASGSYAQLTKHANAIDFDRVLMKQRVAIDVSKRSTAVKSILGKPAPLPLCLSPIGLCGMQRANGEILAARAAAKHSVPFTLSTMSICALEDVRANIPESYDKLWFQLYFMRDREFMKRLINRAKEAQCSALVVTLDLQVLGQRHSDVHNGLSAPPKLYNMKTVVDLATKPMWCLRMLGTRRHTFGNIVGHVSGVEDVSSLSSWTRDQFDAGMNWEHVKWIRDQWNDRPLIVKGIMEVPDALRAAELGVDAIVVSNHGGRQQDCAESSISKLHPISKALRREFDDSGDASSSSSPLKNKKKMPQIHFDGGITSGHNMFKALALGADVVHTGRSYVYGLGALGEEGVDRTISILQQELDVAMALSGVNVVEDIDLEHLVLRKDVVADFGI